MRYQLARPSLRMIGRSGDQQASRFTFEIWNPFIRTYQPVASVEEGAVRAGELAALIGRMWLRQHPKLALLEDVPDADLIERARWAEVRINPTARRTYDTRQDNHPAWTQAVGMARATEAACARVGWTANADGAVKPSGDAPRQVVAAGEGIYG
jgi:hypothetical protein